MIFHYLSISSICQKSLTSDDIEINVKALYYIIAISGAPVEIPSGSHSKFDAILSCLQSDYDSIACGTGYVRSQLLSFQLIRKNYTLEYT